MESSHSKKPSGSTSSYSSLHSQSSNSSFSEPEYFCSICGIKASQKCLTCKLNFCAEDDNRWHHHPSRQSHIRQSLSEPEGYNAETLRRLMKQQSAKLDELMQRCKLQLQKPQSADSVKLSDAQNHIVESHPIPPPRNKKKARQSLQCSPTESPVIPPRARTYSGNDAILGLRPTTIKSLRAAHDACTLDNQNKSGIMRQNNPIASTGSLNNNYYSTIVYSDPNSKKDNIVQKSDARSPTSSNLAQLKNNRHNMCSSQILPNTDKSAGLIKSSSASSLSTQIALPSSVKTTKIETMTSTSVAVSSPSLSSSVSKSEPPIAVYSPIYAVPSKLRQEVNHLTPMQVAKTTTASTQTSKKSPPRSDKGQAKIPFTVLELGSSHAMQNLAREHVNESTRTSSSSTRKLSKKVQILNDIMQIEEPSERCRELELCIAKLDREISIIQEQIAKLIQSLVRSDAIRNGSVKALVQERDDLINILQDLLEYRQHLYQKEAIDHKIRMQEMEGHYAHPGMQPSTESSYIPPTSVPDWDKNLATVGLQSPGFCTLPPGFATLTNTTSPGFPTQMGINSGREDYLSSQRMLPPQSQMFTPYPNVRQYSNCPYCFTTSVLANFCYFCKHHISPPVQMPFSVEENSQYRYLMQPNAPVPFAFSNMGIGRSEAMTFERTILSGNLPGNNSMLYTSRSAASKFNQENSPYSLVLSPENMGSSPSSEEYYSAEDDRDISTGRSRTPGDGATRLGHIKNNKPQNWRCYHCTFINSPKTHICEMCYKTNDKLLENIAVLTAKNKDLVSKRANANDNQKSSFLEEKDKLAYAKDQEKLAYLKDQEAAEKVRDAVMLSHLPRYAYGGLVN